MNTIRSTWIGWGSLCVAGAGAYYFAKRSVNADRASRHEATQRVKQEAARREAEAAASSSAMSRSPQPQSIPSLSSDSQQKIGGSGQVMKNVPTNGFNRDDVGSPSEEEGHDPAATRHEPETEAQRLGEKGKYEAAELFKSRKGGRL